MKKSIIILITPIAILSLLIIGFTNWDSHETNTLKTSINKVTTLEDQNIYGPILKDVPDLYYGVDTRFAAIKKTDINKATTIYDFLNEGEKQQIAHVSSVNIVIIKDNRQSEIQEYGTTARLTKAQIKLIRSQEYFNHFKIKTKFKAKNKETGKLEDHFFSPHITVVPDTQATYVNGKDALIAYLKDNSKDDMNKIDDENLGAIKLSFIISKQGTVKDVKIDVMTSGYPSIDEKFIKLIKNMPGKWIPAENSKGEKIDQELIFTFGPANGC